MSATEWMRPTLGGMGFTHVARCVECDGRIFRHPTWAHFGGASSGPGHKPEARLGTIEEWGESPESVILALHQPMDEEVESWADDENPDEHDSRFPGCAANHNTACEGHNYTLQVCRECGYTHNGETPAYRPWPCATVRAFRVPATTEATP